jgi:hypothetical protein
MTAYFMHYCKKTNTNAQVTAKHSKFSQSRYCLLLWLTFLSLFLSPSAQAIPAQIMVKSAEIVAVEDKFHLNIDLDFQFNSALEDALNKGVPLTFLYEFQLSQPRKYWFDEEVVTQTQRLTISYHALSRQYLIHRQQRQQSYASLALAKEALCKIKDWMVFDKSMLKKGESYQAALRVRLDQSRLPKALQAEAASSEDWTMISERIHWSPIFNL